MKIYNYNSNWYIALRNTHRGRRKLYGPFSEEPVVVDSTRYPGGFNRAKMHIVGAGGPYPYTSIWTSPFGNESLLEPEKALAPIRESRVVERGEYKIRYFSLNMLQVRRRTNHYLGFLYRHAGKICAVSLLAVVTPAQAVAGVYFPLLALFWITLGMWFYRLIALRYPPLEVN